MSNTIQLLNYDGINVSIIKESDSYVVSINYDPVKTSLLNSDQLKHIKYTLEDILDDLLEAAFFNDNEVAYKIDPESSEIIESKCYGNAIDGVYSDIILTEAEGRKRIIPPEIKQLISSRTMRRKMLIKCGKDAFLLPEELKFPVKYPIVDKNGNVKRCEYHCGLIVAAYYRANEWKKKKPHYEKVAQKALELYRKLKCDKSKELPVKIHINESVLPFGEGIIALSALASKF
jgi:hypothetical protein